MIQIQVYKYKVLLALTLLIIQSSFHTLFSLFFSPTFFSYILEYHETQLGTSMFQGKNHNDQEILSKIFSNAFLKYFFCKCYTFLENDWLFDICLNYSKNQELYHYPPKIYPNYSDLSQVLFSIAEFDAAIIKCFINSTKSSIFFILAFIDFLTLFIVFDLGFNYFNSLH